METRIKTYGLIIGILLFVALVAGLAYAYYYSHASSGGVISGTAGCFVVDYDKGNNINGNLILFDESEIIVNNQINISNGMQLTYVNAGINSACTLDGYIDIKINVSTLNTGFISGNSVGALKYVVAEYSPSSYTSPSVSSLNNSSFEIIESGSITSLGEQTIYTDSLPHGTKNGYLIVFYVDGELAQNDVGNSSFSATISAVANQGIAPIPTDPAVYITNLYNNSDKSSVLNNTITYQYDTEHNLMKDNDNNIRYYGANPNNYIYFNCSDYSNQTSDTCEKWRIIGVFDGKIKIVRNSSIGNYSWDTSANGGVGVNEWSQADLMKLLNPGYTFESVGGSLYYNSGSGTCYNGQSNATTSCNFTYTGIKNEATRNMIATVVWNTGGMTSDDVYSDEAYSLERGENVMSNPSDGITRQTTWEGKIAILYPSDYGYAADLRSCSSKLGGYSSCASYNWLFETFNDDIVYFLTPSSSYDDIFASSNYGDVFGYDSPPSGLFGINGSIIPTLYLDDVFIIPASNVGMESNPYKLSVG